ncbi:glycoside hydrolase [uncultured Dysgonomonas sp.]|uniref:Uncharacterized protein n=1 Tax=uncultured Dysgonomonas sp. TaxID=206096 RepID=A0A212JXS6_9BACT|nr:glycoside hydrolase [uncultured Dysgonomonas sp.]SBW04217.1 conserved exported hypothetical protein [uncultured Dysgonomonas sp.]
MINRTSIFLLLLIFSHTFSYGQDIYGAKRKSWLEKAEANKPVLIVTEKKPLQQVEMVKDPDAFQGWKAMRIGAIEDLYKESFKSKVIVDFGEHITGSFSFSVGILANTPDAPLRFKLTFGEVPSEVVTPFDPFPAGSLSRAWLQDEVMTVMTFPAVVTIPRRVSFRYVKIELLANSSYDFNISGMSCKAVTSASSTPEPLLNTTPQIFKDIDRVGLHTLKECMQTVYEDGPKRDQRLWLGDLYLEALANYESFRQNNLTKRCLYLLAALSQPEGWLHGTVFEVPEPHPQSGQKLLDYSFLFTVSLKDYLKATNDRETVDDLWPVAKKQVDIVKNYLQDNGLMDFKRANREWWIFFDWKDNFHREVSLQGISIFALRETYELAKQLNRESEVAELPALIKKMTKAAQKNYYNPKSGFYTGLLNDQISYASQVWMVLGGVPTKAQAQRALNALPVTENVCYPGGPYMYHYYVQALIDSDLPDEARKVVENYWGGMLKKGADTFWEVYDPQDEFRSPYNFYPMNSYCHAWSCTPVYFIRKYPEIFQK